MSIDSNTSGILTITTDWNQHDYYNGVLRGRLISTCPDLKIVELTNQIPAFNLNSAAFILRHSFTHFPEGTIHLVLVNSENCKSQRMLAFSQSGHHFVVADNGVIGLLFKEMPEFVYSFPFESKSSFSSLDSSVKAIESIFKGSQLINIAPVVKDYDQRIPLRATIENSAITGSVIYIDSYNNAITNVSSDLFERVGLGRKFEILVQSQHNKVDQLVKTYNEVDSGELLALFNSEGLLEVAINNGYAAQLLSLNIGSSVRIKFYD
jgi:hypothetical protein